ncbi:ankyrin repeat domain-containing protein [Aureispira sp. CCB-QB1]|uniref:ankyrin repeat domain-containing protein n=1 Tax=Aureispira sp. CCB-QB1 TaxID=1313421 RepID=UPI0006973E0C|nr:ankyrin repeat domain-containing protein [Aureispira sp. CCB-QB1]
MARKRKTLPKNFETLLKEASIEELIKVFDKCELDAYGGYGKKTALAFDQCPHELAKWLVEHGANLKARDTWGNTPLHNRAKSRLGNIESLLELGADIHDNGSSIGTPLHAAVSSHHVKNTQILVERGASIDALNRDNLTPLELTLRFCQNVTIIRVLEIAKILINAKATLSPLTKKLVREIGEQFEFHRNNFNQDLVDEVSNALDELYILFDVTPVKRRRIHDGKSPISVQATTWQQQHQELWNFLVPSSGPAQTIQGEVIRISGRIANELDGNGGINWDSDYKRMADAFYEFVQFGQEIEQDILKELTGLIKEIKRKSGSTARLCEIAVKWIRLNPTPIQLETINYDR